MPKKKAASAQRPPHPQIICPYCNRRFCYWERRSAPGAPQRPAPSLPEPEEAGEVAAKKSTSPSPQRTRSSTPPPNHPPPPPPRLRRAPSRPSSPSTGRMRRRSRRKKK